MDVLITGVCGFVGSSIARGLADDADVKTIYGIDNLVRKGSETNRRTLIDQGVILSHGDLRLASDLECLPDVDWVIDAAALPSVMAGVNGKSSSKQLVEHNLLGTIHLLEYCKRVRSGVVLLSTSRVYSIDGLASLPLEVVSDAFHVVDEHLSAGVSPAGITEAFSTQAPVSLYGATKISSEAMALEYGMAFDFPVFVNRCGVIAGPRQFGRPDQGIFSFWLRSHQQRQPLEYLGFGGSGHQVRDCLHVDDLVELVRLQIRSVSPTDRPQVVHASGGIGNAMSLRQLTHWCNDRFGTHEVLSSEEERPFDLPWVVLDHSLATKTWNWTPKVSIERILEEIAQHAEANPDWLVISG